MADQAVIINNSSDFQNLKNIESLSKLAINAAIANDWTQAIDLNKQIINLKPQDIDASNRMGRAYLETGNLEQAKKTYQKVLKLDQYNIIALKNLKRLAKVKDEKKIINGQGTKNCFDSQMFLSEPGKTKLVNLVKLATPAVLSGLYCGDEVYLFPKKFSISVCDQSGQYLGALPDDLSHHLIRLLAGGNKYQTYVRKIGSNILQVFIKESIRAKKFANQPSFWESNCYNYTAIIRQHEQKSDVPEIEVPDAEEEV